MTVGVSGVTDRDRKCYKDENIYQKTMSIFGLSDTEKVNRFSSRVLVVMDIDMTHATL